MSSKSYPSARTNDEERHQLSIPGRVCVLGGHLVITQRFLRLIKPMHHTQGPCDTRSFFRNISGESMPIKTAIFAGVKRDRI